MPTYPTFDADLGGEGHVEAMRSWNENATAPITARDRAGIIAFFDGPDLVEPGLVPCSRWRTGPDSPAAVPQFGGVAVKP